MRSIKLTIVLAFFYFTSAAQNTKAIDKLDGVYISKDNFCSASILFIPNGEFYYEGGCEARSNIAKGNYKIDGKKITLSTAAVPLQYSINLLDTKKRSTIQITLKDADGKLLRYTKVLTLPYRVNNDTLKKVGFLETDSIGQLIINRSKISAISLDRYNIGGWLGNTDHIYNWEPISNINSSQISIQFNYPIFCLRYPEIVLTSFVLVLQTTNKVTELIDEQNKIYKKFEQ